MVDGAKDWLQAELDDAFDEGYEATAMATCLPMSHLFNISVII